MRIFPKCAHYAEIQTMPSYGTGVVGSRSVKRQMTTLGGMQLGIVFDVS